MFTEIVRKEQTSKQDLSEFLAAVFAADDSIEIRLIETWRENGHSKSRVIDRFWPVPEELLESWSSLHDKNMAGANVFFGVNPRSGKGGTKDDVLLCRALWADLDNARPSDETTWAALPPPSLVVDSGRGVHLYWRLSEPVALDTSDIRSHVEQILKGMYAALSSDSVQDVTRLLRLPGFDNVKDFRNGRPPQPCHVAFYDKDCRYRLAEFERFKIETEPPASESRAAESVPSNTQTIFGKRFVRRIRGLVRLLEKDTDDRSKRDFFVVTKLLSLGCTPEEICGLVSEYSKFKGNETYLSRTLENAQRLMGR